MHIINFSSYHPPLLLWPLCNNFHGIPPWQWIDFELNFLLVVGILSIWSRMRSNVRYISILALLLFFNMLTKVIIKLPSQPKINPMSRSGSHLVHFHCRLTCPCPLDLHTKPLAMRPVGVRFAWTERCSSTSSTTPRSSKGWTNQRWFVWLHWREAPTRGLLSTTRNDIHFRDNVMKIIMKVVYSSMILGQDWSHDNFHNIALKEESTPGGHGRHRLYHCLREWQKSQH